MGELPYRVLSLGAGVQSSTVLLMSCRGVLPKVDAVIFADTQWEPRAVYAWLDWLEEQAAAAGIPLYRVSAGNIREDMLAYARGDQTQGRRGLAIPAFMGDGGQIRRQCTSRYKIEPVQKQARKLAAGRPVEMWFGISADETRRVRFSQVRWITHRYSLIFDLDPPVRRRDCLAWMEQHGYPQPPRSACIGCPYHSDAEWRAIRDDPEAWADAVAVDAAIRRSPGLREEAFLHAARVPLDQVDLSTAEERGQLNWLNECEGMCGV